MTDDTRDLRHELRNAEQDKLALKKMLNRAADEIDDLADADCSPASIEHARSQAKRLRKVSGPKKK